MNLQSKIDKKKETITRKKNHLEEELSSTKRKIVSPMSVGLTTLGGFLIGYFLLPNRTRFLKTVLKVATFASTARQMLDLLPRHKKEQVNDYLDKIVSKTKNK